MTEYLTYITVLSLTDREILPPKRKPGYTEWDIRQLVFMRVESENAPMSIVATWVCSLERNDDIEPQFIRTLPDSWKGN